MLIRQLFSPERDPTRHLNEVVNAEEAIDPRSEIDEYVFTDHTREYLRTLVDGILDSGQGVMPDCLCGWISGFFGSGKSHFLKLAGALLENRSVPLPGGIEKPALEYAVARHGLALPWERIAREFKIRTVTVNLAMAHGGSRQAQEKPLLYRLASDINRAWGYSPVPHIAMLEREIQKARKWDAFLKAVRDHNERVEEVRPDGTPCEWTDPEMRGMASEAHRVLEGVLPGVLPKYERVREYLADREREQPTPESVVGLALELATSLHPDLGRVLLCVDEVALYLKGGAVGFDGDRVREVQGLAESVKNKGKGKVFLFATAQLRVDTIDSAFSGLSAHVMFLRDRFPKGGRLDLEERDIDTVVRERWLKKDPEAPDYPTLERLVRDNGGLLARSTKLRDESLIRDTDGLTDPQAILAYYPCLPYHIRLLQSVLEALRGERQIDQTAAQSRALLTAVRSLFLPQNGANLAGAEVGALVTFDRVYDVIRDVVRKADSGTDRWITETIETTLGACGNVRVSSVAKVIFLLQHLNPGGQRRLRVSAENVAALLYPRLGASWEPHLKDVRDACQNLLAEHFIGEDADLGYRFYRPEEKTFQAEVESQPIDEAKLRELIREIIGRKVADLGMKSVPVTGGHKLDATVTVHVGPPALPDPHARPKGIELHVIANPGGVSSQQIRVWAAQYQAAAHVALWALTSIAEAEDLARRSLKLAKAIDEYTRRHGQHGVDFLKGEQAKLNTLRDTQLPEAVGTAIVSGTVIHMGVDTVLAGGAKKPLDVFRDTMKRAVEQVFTQLEDGCAIADEQGLRKVLTWRSPQPQPEFFAALKLFDAAGQPLVDRPFLREIVLALQGRPEAERTGKAIVAHFAEAPYGWPERAVKAGLGALVRGRRLAVKLPEGGAIRAETDPKAESWLTGTQQFNRAVLELSDISVTAEERHLLQRLFADVFERPVLDTIEKLEREAPVVLRTQLALAREALADLRGRQLPGADTTQALVRLLDTATEPDLPAGVLKQLATGARSAAGGEDPVAALARWVSIVRAVARLREQAKLDRLADIRARVTLLYPGWSGAANASLAADINALQTQVTSDILLAQADLAIERDARVFAAYAADYRERHDARRKRSAEAVSRLEAHPAWSIVGAAVKDTLRRGVTDLGCDNAADLALTAARDGRCPQCRASLAELTTHCELVETREARALRELDAALVPFPPTQAPSDAPTLTVEIRSVDDLPKLYERIAEAGRTALSRPRRVRVTFEDIG